MRSSTARNITNTPDLQVSGIPVPGSIPIFDANGRIKSSIVLINNLGNITTPGALVAGSVPPDPTTPGYQMDYLNTDTITEKTSGNGVSVSGTVFKTGEFKCLTGITIDTGSNKLAIPAGVLAPIVHSADNLVLSGDAIEVIAAGGVDFGGADLTNIGQLTADSISADSLLIAGQSFVSGNTLGSFVTQSSLTGVGALTIGSIGSGFGAINIGTNTLQCGNITTTGVTSSGTLRGPGAVIHTSSSSHVTDRLLIGSTSDSGTVISVLSLRGKNASSQSPTILSAWDLTTGANNSSPSALTITDGVERIVVTADCTDVRNKLKVTSGLIAQAHAMLLNDTQDYLPGGYMLIKIIVQFGNSIVYMPDTAEIGELVMLCARVSPGATLTVYPTEYGAGSICGSPYITLADRQLVVLFCFNNSTWEGGYQ